MHHHIDALAYTNGLRSLPPEHKLGFAAALFILGYVGPPQIQALIALWLVLWTVVYARIPLQSYVKLLAVPVGFIVTSLPALVLGITTDPTAVVGDQLWGGRVGLLWLYASQQGVTQAGLLVMRAIALIPCLYFVLLTVPFVEILRVLRRVGCPPLLTELMMLMYRFIFVLTTTASELLTAQQSRLGYGNWRVGMHSLSVLIGQLLGRTLENYRQLALGLRSRGFTGELRVWSRRHYRVQWRYVGEAIVGYTVLVTLTVLHYTAQGKPT